MKKPLTGREKAELDALLNQYSSLREESMNSTNNRIQILILGVTAIAALVGGALTIDEPDKKIYLIYSIFSVAVPLVAVYILLLWTSEAVRAHRAGYFIATQIEPKVNLLLEESVMTWEISLWSKRLPRDELYGPSMMALAALGLFAVVAPPIGMLHARQSIDFNCQTFIAMGIPYLFLGLAALYMKFHMMKRLRNIPIALSTEQVDASGTSTTDSR